MFVHDALLNCVYDFAVQSMRKRGGEKVIMEALIPCNFKSIKLKPRKLQLSLTKKVKQQSAVNSLQKCLKLSALEQLSIVA